MKDLEKTSTIELIKDLNIIQKKLKLYIEKQNIIKRELIRRIPSLINEDSFIKSLEMEDSDGKENKNNLR